MGQCNSIVVNGRRIRAAEGIWHLGGKWMIVWDSNKIPYIRKVVCVLPAKLGVMFPVYAYDVYGSYNHACWLRAGYIPEGLDVSGIDGWYDMKKDMDL